MKTLAIFTFFILAGTTFSFAQAVKINPSDKKIPRGTAGVDKTHEFSVSVINCDPRKIETFSFVNLNSGTLSSKYYVINDLVFNRVQSDQATFTIDVQNPATLPKKSETIVLKFELKLRDSTIYNYDTITFTFKHEHAIWHEDTTNIWRTEYNQYTDLLGFDNQRPNGLLQQELIIKFPFKLPVWGNPDKTTKLQLFRSVVFHALFNRIDKSKEFQNYPSGTAIPTTSVNADSLKPFLTTLDIFKYSNLQLGLNFNFITFHLGNFRINFDYEFSLLRNKPYYADTIRSNNTTFTQNDVRPVYSHAHKMEIYLNNNKSINGKFDVIVNAGVMWIRLRDSYYRQFDAAEVDIFDRATLLLLASDAINGRKAQSIAFFGGTLKMKWGTNLKNSIFFRTNYYFQDGDYRRYTGPTNAIDPKRFEQRKFYNHFLQLQLGLALNLNKFFGIEEN
jgi:hypothetical protein